MPVSPEHGNVGLQIRPVKIFWDRNSEQTRRTDRDVRVSRKGRLDFDSIRQQPHPQDRAVRHRQVGQNSRHATMPVLRPRRRLGTQLGQELLVTLGAAAGDNHPRPVARRAQTK